MKNALYIRGIGTVGSFGPGLDYLLRAAEDGRPLNGPATSDTGELERFIPTAKLRRAQHFVRMALLAAHLAMEDVGKGVMDKTGLIVATGCGPAQSTFDFLDSIIAGGAPLASPTAFSLSVHNIAASSLSIHLGLGGPSLTVSQFSLSLASALVTARVWLAEGRVGAVLLGAVDEYSGFLTRCEGMADGPDNDWRLASDIPPGEGAMFMLLSSSPGDKPCCSIEGVSVGRPPEAWPNSEAVIAGQGAVAAASLGLLRLPGHLPVHRYAPAYGHTPAGMAFDAALAASCLERGRSLPGSSTSVRRVTCIESAPSGLTAVLSLAREEDGHG